MRFLFFPCLALAIFSLCACNTAGTPEEAFGWQRGGSERNGDVAGGAPASGSSSSGTPSSGTPSPSPPSPSPPFSFEGTGETIVLDITETELSAPAPETEPSLQPDTPESSRDVPNFSQESHAGESQSVEFSSSVEPTATTTPIPDTVTARDAPSVSIALLLPLEAPRPEVARIATDMRNAAEMALFALNKEEISLIPLDTGGNVEGARESMEQAIAAGADIILGPLLASSVRASAPLAAENGLTMIAFSNDFTVLDENILLLNFSPEQDVEQILSYAMNRGIRDFAAMLPDTAYGERVRSIVKRFVADAGAELHGIEFYSRVIDGPYEPAQRLAALSRDGRSPPFRAVLLADDGQMLRIAASALAYFDIAPPDVQLLGTHLWDDVGVFEEPALLSGWYPMPRSESYEVFRRRYEEIYGGAPDQIAGLAYDAVSLVGLLVQEGGDWRTEPAPPQMLLRPGGFTGIQGLFRFLPDGRSERSLAVWEIGEEEAELLQAPKQSFAEDG